MNKELLERIESMEKELAALKKDVVSENKVEPKRFIPKKREKYFYVNRRGEVSISYYDTENPMDRFDIKTRNCFRTEEEAEDYNRFLDIESRLRNLADELEDNDNYFFIPIYNKKDDCISTVMTPCFNPIVSCKNSNFLRIAEERIGFEDLKFYLTYKR